MQTNEFARGCKCVLRSSLTRPHLLQPSTAAIHHALLRKIESALSSNNASKNFIYLFIFKAFSTLNSISKYSGPVS